MGASDALLAGDSLDAQAADLEGLLQRLSDVNEVGPASTWVQHVRRVAVNSRNEGWQMCFGRIF